MLPLYRHMCGAMMVNEKVICGISM